ncbi:hypothetical protein BH23CHL6_BH23CHL6_12880 [soil metagenome]
MSSDRDLAPIVRSWLEQGATRLPDRVLDSVLDQLPQTHQRRHWWTARRNTLMSNTLKMAMATGAIALAVVLGLGILLGSDRNVAAPPQPTPTVAPTASPVAVATPVAPSASPDPSVSASPMSFTDETGLLEPGTYVVDDEFPARLTFSIPEGWAHWGADQDSVGLYKNSLGYGPSRGMAMGFMLAKNVFLDACRTHLGEMDPPVGPTAEDLAQALAELPGIEATTPIDVTFGGHEAKYLELTAPETLTGCRIPRFFSTPDDNGRDIFGSSEFDRVWIVDVGDTRVVFLLLSYPGTPAAEVAELEDIIQSVRIEAP